MVAALRLLGRRNAGTPFEIASTPVRAAQPEEKARASRNSGELAQRTVPALGRLDLQTCALGVGQAAGEQLEQSVAAHPQDGEHEEVGRYGEERARLAHPAQVERGQHGHRGHGDRGLVADQCRDRAGGVLRGRRDRHRHRQHVVDEQGARHRDAGGATEVGGRDLVVATAGGIGVDRLPVGRDHGQHHQGDRETDLPRPDVRRGTGDREHDEDLVRRVGDRRQRVAGEHREGDLLGKQRLAELRATELATQQDPLRDVADTHDGTG